MKHYIILIFFSSTLSMACAQPSEKDSLFTLTRNITVETTNIGEHGIDYFENNKRLDSITIANDFATISRRASIDTDKYKLLFIKNKKNVIKVFESTDTSNLLQLVEVVTIEFSKNKKIPVKRINYLILSKTSKQYVELEIDENGVNYYEIDNRKVHSVRERMLYLNDDIDNSAFKEAKKIIEKYKLN
jgi:hypothetical protein